MTMALSSAIVRMRTTDSHVVGTGFLVTGHHVLTCAHVVIGALNLPQGLPDPPQADLHLDFPLLAPESTLTARVSHWQPAVDVAVLELVTAPPAESKPARLVTADDLWGHSFRALGFPAGYEQGVWASGVLRGRQADGWLQIEDTTETGYLIAPGFSGGPVWDDVLGGIVGAGLLVGQRQILTCAHVVAQALGLPDDTPEPAQTEATCWKQTPHRRAG